MKRLIFILLSTFCMAQTDQYKEILLSKQIGKKVDSYHNGYGTFHIYKSEAGIVDSLGSITYTAPKNGYISHIRKNRFILYIEGKNYQRKEGIIDAKGNYLIAPEYQDIGNWWNYEERIIITKNGKDTLYDYGGNQYISDKEKIKYVDKDRAFVKENDGWYLYDIQGNKLSDRKYDEYFYFENGRARLKNEIIDLNGKTLHTFKNHDIYNIDNYPYLIIENPATKKYGLIDTDGNVLAEEIYDNFIPAPILAPIDDFILFTKNKDQFAYSILENKIVSLDKKFR